MPCGAGEFFGELTGLRLVTPGADRELVAHPSHPSPDSHLRQSGSTYFEGAHWLVGLEWRGQNL